MQTASFKEMLRLKNEGTLYAEREDGQIVNVPVWLHKPKNRNSYNGRWLTLFLDDAEGTGVSLIEMAADKRLTETDFRVRDYMFCKIGFDNAVYFNQSEAARYLGIAQPNISTSIKKLLELGIILAGPSTGKIKSYIINSAIAHFGKHINAGKARNKAIAERKKVVQFAEKLEQGNLLI